MIWQAQQSDPRCLVIVDPQPRSGEDNMELDRRALELVCHASTNQASPQSLCRIYRWNTPTVTLGYFQAPDASVPSTISGCPKIKRLTGGGAILHDLELTYSVAIPAQHSIRHDPLKLYDVVHTAIINTLATQNVASSMRRDSSLFSGAKLSDSHQTSNDPFLCFLRHDDRDIVIGKNKVVGSAQRRRKGSILQHGSILLEASRYVPDVLGLRDLVPEFDAQQLSDQLAVAIAESIAPEYEILKSDAGQHKLHQLMFTSPSETSI